MLAGITATGLLLFIAPLLLGSRFPQAVLLFSALVGVSALVVLAVAVQTHRLSTRLLAILAALVAVDAVMRLVIVIGLLGFSPIFSLIIAGGFAMGPSFGFASGALTLLLSAVLTAGLGPWLPYQMLAAGWVGMGAGYFGRLTGRSTARPIIGLLALYGAVAGLAYGMLLDLWEWPLLLNPAGSALSWAPGLGLGALVTTALFTIGKLIIVVYLGRVAFASAYGAAGSFVVLLLWIYYSAQIFLLGAEFTYTYAYQQGSRIERREPGSRR